MIPRSRYAVGAPAATPVAVTATLETAATMIIQRYDWSRRRLARTASAALAPDASMTGSADGVWYAGWAASSTVISATMRRLTRRSYRALTTTPTNAIGTSSG